MMELTCAFILISASLVIASPHGYGGYGVKGGASARAEASASAGGGYSGSFSKSSSSSSASSSASSSSSSSSFSYGGSGAGGFGLESGVPNHGGCSAGTCHTARSNGVPTSLGSLPQGYNSANAAASAEAGAISGLGCQGLSCGANSDKCKSGQCKPHTGTTSSNSDLNKCTSGQCGSSLDISATPTDNGSNDIRVSYSSGSADNANDQHSGIENSSSGYTAGSDCSHGKCGPSGSSNSKLDYNHDFGNSYQGSSASNKPQGSTADSGITSQYLKPSSHLETPKLDSKCNSGNCNDRPAESGHENSPSSYNVPIHGAYKHGNPKPCDGVKCENQPKGPYSPTGDTVTKRPSSFDYPSTVNCGGSGCFGISANQAVNQPSHTVGHSPSKTPTDTVTSCKSPNCSPYPTNPAGSSVLPGHVGHDKPSDDNKISNDNLPSYTGGFGGPAGLLKPNEYDLSAPPGNPSHGPANIHNGKPLHGTPTVCNTPGCTGYPSPSRPTGGSVPEGTYNHLPGGEIPSGKLPNYTSGFGPTGMLKPNEFNVHGTVANTPNYAHTGSSLSNTPAVPAGNTGSQGCKLGQNCGGYTPTVGQLPAGNTGSQGCKLGQNCGGYTPTAGQLPAGNTGSQGCKLGQNCGGYTPTAGQLPASNTGAQGCKLGQNCGGYTPIVGTTIGVTAPSGYYGSTKPHTGSNSNNGLGGPADILNPDKHYHGTGPSSPGYTPSETFNTPTSSGHPGGCKTPNCYASFGSTAAPHAPAQPYGDIKPSSGSHLSSVPIPAYTNDYDRPSGVHSDISGPASTPSFTHTQSPSSPGGYSTGCKTGNCANYPTSGEPGSFGVTKPNTNVNTAPSHPQYSGGFGGPSGTFKPTEHTHVAPSTSSAPTSCGTPNCVGSPSASAGATSGANAQSGSYGITKPDVGNNPSNENPIYNGGFGGAAGLLKPNEYTVPAVSTKPNNQHIGGPATAACTSGHCDTQPPHSSAPHIDNTSSGAHATAAAAAVADAVVYSGGFGGAAGLLKPNEYTVPAVSPKPNNQHTGVPTTSACTSGHCHTQPPHSSAAHIDNTSSGAHATAAAAAVADAVVYSGGFGGPPGVLTPYDDGKIGALPTNGGQAHGLQTGDAHGSHNANIHSQHGKIPVATGGPSGPTGVRENTGAQAGSLTGATAYAGAAAGASAGAHGYNPHASHYNHEGNIKGGSPCGGGCSGSPSGATAKSLSGAGAFGVGGSYTSSSASAHASAGAYTKGGYGKR